ncbi:hypothetical protein N7528_003006 [Penicillium herquei]|nr:hypothetical protein N7528_003006 [Penicillium herquei]
MRAVRFHGREDVRVDEVEEPVCGAGQIKIRPAFVGICGSDLHEYLHGPFAVPTTPHKVTGDQLPTTLGHEFSGTVEEVGEEVTGFKVGDKVAVNPSLSDGTCGSCQMGRYNSCYSIGFIGFSSKAGGLSDHIVLDKKHVVLLPDSMPLDIGALVEPLSVAWHAVSRCPVQKGDTALIVGAGPIGLAILQVLKAQGIEKILVVEVSKERVKFAHEFGATKVLNPNEVDALAEIREFTGDVRGVAVAFECTGVQAGMDTALGGTRARGTTVTVSLWGKPPVINAMALVHGERHIVGAAVYEPEDFQAVIDAISSGKIKPRPMITSKVPMQDVVDKGIKALIYEKESHVKILVDISA